MASSSAIVLTPDITGQVCIEPLKDDAAKKTSELLQQNHDKHHIFFNDEGFHNHIVHHLLVLYAFGASPDTIQRQYDHNASYQRPPQPLDDKIVKDFTDPVKFKEHLGDERYFRDYLVFFQKEIGNKGVDGVFKEYLLKQDERANDFLVRLYAGFLHPLIHLGYGIEFKQPTLAAEGLAEAAVHDNWIGKYLVPAEKGAEESKEPGKSLLHLLEESLANEKLRKSAHWEDANKIRDGIIARAAEEMIQIATQWKVKEDELEEKTMEMIDFCVYMAVGALNPKKEVKFDFFYMHCINSSIFFTEFLKTSWLSNADKARLLEWKGRVDLAMYISRGSPKLDLTYLKTYESKKNSDWNGLFQRAREIPDDGHVSKFIRGLANGEKVTKPYEGKEHFKITGDDWVKIANMVMDSTEGADTKWIRAAGFEEAWKEFKDRPKL